MRKRGHLITCIVAALLISSCGNRSSNIDVVSLKKTEDNGTGFKETLSANQYVYYGKIKDGRPEWQG